MIETFQIKYNIQCQSSRLAKTALTKSIVQKWRHEQIPSGRFLKRNEVSGLWDDVGDREAHKKTAQALREKAPVIRRGKWEKWSDSVVYLFRFAFRGGLLDPKNNDCFMFHCSTIRRTTTKTRPERRRAWLE
jgi:hypothetical protein